MLSRDHGKVLFPLAAVLLVAACATEPDIRSDYDPSANFSAYRTYNIMDRAGQSQGGAPYESFAAQRIRAAVESEMEARGYVKSESPDIYVNFYVTVQQVQKVSQVPATRPQAYGPYGYRRYGTWYGPQTETWVRNYNEGTLLIDIVDAASNKLVWEGVGRGRLTQDEVDNISERAANGVAKVMARYPFRAGS